MSPIPQVVGQDSEGKDIIEYLSPDDYMLVLKKRYDNMNERIKNGIPKGMSLIEVMRPAQDLFNYSMMKLESLINVNS